MLYTTWFAIFLDTIWRLMYGKDCRPYVLHRYTHPQRSPSHFKSYSGHTLLKEGFPKQCNSFGSTGKQTVLVKYTSQYYVSERISRARWNDAKRRTITKMVTKTVKPLHYKLYKTFPYKKIIKKNAGSHLQHVWRLYVTLLNMKASWLMLAFQLFMRVS